MVTIRDIAKMADVSKTTVSRVINNHQYVSEEIREKVQRVIEETGYVVNGNAIKLSNGKNYTLGVTLPYNSSCYDRLVNSLLFHAREKGYQVLLLPTYYDEQTENDYYALLEKRMIDGLILVSRAECYERYFGEVSEGTNFFTGIEGYEEGYHWAKETYKKLPLPEVIYANADDTAAGIIHGLQELGFTHKKEFRLIGEGNLPYSQLLEFTTIDFLPDEIGPKVIDYLLSDQETIDLALEPRIIRR